MFKISIGFGSIIAATISWYAWHSPIWMLIHLCFSWVYVFYYLAIYVFPWMLFIKLLLFAALCVGLYTIYDKYKPKNWRQ